MEEKKLKNEERKLSYDELQNLCGEYFQRLQIMQREMAKMDATNVIQRLNFLFKVLDNAVMFDAGFVESTVKEIQDTLTVVEEKENKDE